MGLKFNVLGRQRYSTQLVLGIFVLVLLTTFSAGGPAYWFTRLELERQTWLLVENAGQATSSLLLAEQERLKNLATLFSERPTLQILLADLSSVGLQPYLLTFQEQSHLDILLLCTEDGQWLAGSLTNEVCPNFDGLGLFASQPAIIVGQHLDQAVPGREQLVAFAGTWLNSPYLSQLANTTGVAQNILLSNGQRIASNRPELIDTIASLPKPSSAKGIVTIQGQPYYVLTTPLNETFFSEIALPVAVLVATEAQALSLLIISTSLVASIGVVLGVWYIRRLTTPLQQLTEVAEQIGQGDFVAIIPTFVSPIEVSTLATALNKSHTRMTEALEELAEARNWLTNLIQAISEGVLTFDQNGLVTFLSQGAERLLGWQNGEAVGQPIQVILPLPGCQDYFNSCLPPAGQKKQIDTFTHHGRPLSLAVTGSRLTPPDGTTSQTALVLRDVTEEELLGRLRSYFLANISHEFRTPLSTLNASIQLLLEEAETLSATEIHELLRPTSLSLLGLQTLVDNLLESSRIEAGRFVIRQRFVSLTLVAANALAIVRPLLERRQQPLTLTEPANLPEIRGDSARLTQVLVNLLTNASLYSPMMTAIEMQLHAPAGAWLRVSVADRGPGVPPAGHTNLFGPFIRLDSDDSQQYGIGLGLYVVKTTIEAHSGRVGVDDRPGGGSIFWFELPINRHEK